MIAKWLEDYETFEPAFNLYFASKTEPSQFLRTPRYSGSLKHLRHCIEEVLMKPKWRRRSLPAWSRQYC